MAAIVLVTGPKVAGKTTVSVLLARRFELGVHLALRVVGVAGQRRVKRALTQ